MSQQKITFGGVDILRFPAAVMVMVYHYGFWVWAYPDGVSARATGGIPQQPAIGAWVESGSASRSSSSSAASSSPSAPKGRRPCGFSKQG